MCVAVLGCSHLLLTAATSNAQLATRLAPTCCAFVWYYFLFVHKFANYVCIHSFRKVAIGEIEPRRSNMAYALTRSFSPRATAVDMVTGTHVVTGGSQCCHHRALRVDCAMVRSADS